MSREQLLVLTTSARLHANNLRSDISNATTRVEHIRLTTLALEAEAIAASLESIRNENTDESHVTGRP
jgi:hypothetical protein